MGKKKVGIITYHFARNYGAVLQCYALRKYLENEGYDAEVINAVSRNQEKNNSLFNKKSGVKNIIVNACLLPFTSQRKRKESLFADFVNKYITCSRLVRDNEQLEQLVNDERYSAIITGSDQVWNPHIADFEDMFFYPFQTLATKIGYSVSIGESSYADIEKYSVYARNFKYIGLREIGAKTTVEKLCDHDVTDTVDPVLLLSKNEWEKVISIDMKLPKKKYLLCYLIDKGPIKQNMAIAHDIAEKKGLDIKYIWMHLGTPSFGKNFINDAGPTEFLSYIYNAEAVMTDGYHGTVFATIFNKELYSVINNRKSTDSRIKDYLALVGLSDRVLYRDAPVILEGEIDYSLVNIKIQKLPQVSKEFLKKAICGDMNNE